MEHAELSPVFDQKLRGYISTGPTDDTVMLLEQLFKHLPSEGKRNLVDDVVGCTSDQELCQLAGNIDLGFLRPIKVATEKRLPNTRFLPIDGADGDDYFQQLVEKGMVEDDPIVWKQLRLRRDCLYRDGDMCVVSKLFNTSSKHKPPGKMTMRLEVAHILPFSLGDFSEKFWNSLYRYFPAVRTHVNLECANLNILENTMMLSTALFDDFSDFCLALKPTSVPNRYYVKTFSDFSGACDRFLPEDRLLSLTWHDTRYALPHPVLLETHYILASILHVTGRVNLVNDMLEDYQDSCGLAGDGSTDIARLLSVMLSSAVEHDKSSMT